MQDTRFVCTYTPAGASSVSAFLEENGILRSLNHFFFPASQLFLLSPSFPKSVFVVKKRPDDFEIGHKIAAGV